jgi:hypothetical protein
MRGSRQTHSLGEMDYEKIPVTIIAQTDKAVMCITEEDTPDEQEIWIPLSVISNGGDVEGSESEIEVARWFLDKNNINY